MVPLPHASHVIASIQGSTSLGLKHSGELEQEKEQFLLEN